MSPQERSVEACDAMTITNIKPVKKADHFVDIIGKTDVRLAQRLECEHQKVIDLLEGREAGTEIVKTTTGSVIQLKTEEL